MISILTRVRGMVNIPGRVEMMSKKWTGSEVDILPISRCFVGGKKKGMLDMLSERRQRVNLSVFLSVDEDTDDDLGSWTPNWCWRRWRRSRPCFIADTASSQSHFHAPRT